MGAWFTFCINPGIAADPVEFIGPLNYVVGGSPTWMAVGRLKEGGNHFVAATTAGSNDVSIFVGNELGELTGPVTYESNFGPNAVAIGDFNDDGNNDLVLPSRSGGMALHLGTGTEIFFKSGDSFTNDSTSPVISDLNNDGNLDVAMILSRFAAITVVLGNESGIEGYYFGNFTTSQTPRHLAAGDIDLDGNVDLIAATSEITILWGEGTGAYFQRSNFSAGDSPISVAVGDFNNDGNPDIVSANRVSNNISVLLGTGTRSLGEAKFFPVGNAPSSVAIADFNKDGIDDVVVANKASNNVSVLTGDGSGGFSTAVNYGVGNTPIFVVPVDIDDNGSVDLAVANAGSNDISILINTFAGTPLVISPKAGGDTGQVTVQIVGSGFVEGTTVKLTRVGLPDVVSGFVTVGSSSSIYTSFDLTGKEQGLWDVAVTVPGEAATILPGAFTIEAGRAPQVWVDIIGRRLIRAGRANRYSIMFGNRGNIDASAAYFAITGIPSTADVNTGFGIFVDPVGKESSPALPDNSNVLDTNDGKFIPVHIGIIPAGFSGALPPIEITVQDNEPFELIVIKISAGSLGVQ